MREGGREKGGLNQRDVLAGGEGDTVRPEDLVATTAMHDVERRGRRTLGFFPFPKSDLRFLCVAFSFNILICFQFLTFDF